MFIIIFILITRIDATINLHLPNNRQRLFFTIKAILDILVDFIPDSSKLELARKLDDYYIEESRVLEEFENDETESIGDYDSFDNGMLNTVVHTLKGISSSEVDFDMEDVKTFLKTSSLTSSNTPVSSIHDHKSNVASSFDSIGKND